MALISLFGCAADPKLKELSGKWVDINSEDTLIFDGSKMTWISGSYKEDYKVKIRTEANTDYVSNTGKYESFGIVSDLQITGKNHLLAYEMILDADGHKYEFVREAEKALLLGIVDNSKDLPKKIKSHDITHMSFSFYAYPSYKLKDIPEAHIQFEFDNEDGECSVRYSEAFDSYMGRRFDGTVPLEFAADLDEVIRECGLIEKNGYYRHNAVDTYGYSFYIEYESDEEVVIRSEGDDALNIDFDLDRLMNYIIMHLDFDQD